MPGPLGKNGQAKFRDLQVVQYDRGLGYEGEAGERSGSPILKGLIYHVRESSAWTHPNRHCQEIHCELYPWVAMPWTSGWSSREGFQSRERDDQDKPGPQSQKDQIARQSRQNLGPGNKRVKIITRALVLGTREKPRSLSFSQTSIGGNWEPSFRVPFQSILNLLFLERGIGQGWRGQAEPLRGRGLGCRKRTKTEAQARIWQVFLLQQCETVDLELVSYVALRKFPSYSL